MPNVTKNKISANETELTIELNEQKLIPFLEGAAKKLSQENPPKGFRPGKITLEHAKKVYGEMTLYETALNDIVKNTLPDAVRKENIRFIGQPEVTVVKCAPGNPVVYTAKMTLIPEVTLGNYKEIKIIPKEISVEEKEVDVSIEHLRNSRAKEIAVDREVKEGDHVLASVKISLDNVPIEGANHQDHHIFVGKEELYPGLSKKIIGFKKGEKKDVSIDLPKDFWQKQLAGKTVEADITIKEIYERTLPELTDDFAKGFGPFQTVEDLKKQLRDTVREEKEMKEKQRQESELLQGLTDQSTFTDIPEMLILDEQKRILAENKELILRRGLKWEDYLTHIKKSESELESGFKEAAVSRLKKNLVLAELTKELAIEVDDQAIEKEWEQLKMRDSEAVDIEKKDPERTVGIKQHIRTLLTNKKIFDTLLKKTM